MDAYATHTPSCPVCQRTTPHSPHKSIRGLLACQHCRECLVVTWSGHYVRDPFVNKAAPVDNQDEVARALRRTSHPIARLRRDLGLRPSPATWVVIGSVMVLVGMACWMFQTSNSPSVPPANPPQTALETSP